jgi:hypothetical protein
VLEIPRLIRSPRFERADVEDWKYIPSGVESKNSLVAIASPLALRVTDVGLVRVGLPSAT